MNKITLITTAVFAIFSFATTKAQIQNIPCPAMVGYWETWGSGDLAQIDDRYNIIQISFATPKTSTNMTMEFRDINNPSAFKTKMKTLQNKGKKVLVSVGGANDPIKLFNDQQKNDFINSMDALMAEYGFDGMDIDIESSSFDFGPSWTMSAPAVGQTNWVEATKSLMSKFQARTGKKMILTAAPETVYLMGALSEWQISNVNGGAFLPILEGLKEEMDLLHVQYYNATENIAIDGKVHKEGTPNFTVAMTESIIKGFTLLKNKGKYNGFPAYKVAPGMLSCTGGGSGDMSTAQINTAIAYLRRGGTPPGAYVLQDPTGYPELAGLMVWSINSEVGCGNKVPAAFAASFPNSDDCFIGIQNKNYEDLKFSVYPIPSSTHINIEINGNKLNSRNIKIIDPLGNIVAEQKISDTFSKIDVSQLNRGVYFVRIDNTTKKIVIN